MARYPSYLRKLCLGQPGGVRESVHDGSLLGSRMILGCVPQHHFEHAVGGHRNLRTGDHPELLSGGQPLATECDRWRRYGRA
jgi:hypothetical protein